MMELPLEYQKELASQIIFISAFLGGFSAAVLGTLILSESGHKMLKHLITGTSLSAISFIVAVFAMTSIIITATPGYPFQVSHETTLVTRTIGSLAFFAGILSLLFVIAASGWMHSKRVGITTTIFGLIGLILILICQ